LSESAFFASSIASSTMPMNNVSNTFKVIEWIAPYTRKYWNVETYLPSNYHKRDEENRRQPAISEGLKTATSTRLAVATVLQFQQERRQNNYVVAVRVLIFSSISFW
jgi:hypothetical protein